MGKPWFSHKRYGYGAGLPISWEGWAILAGYFVALLAAIRIVDHTVSDRHAAVITILAIVVALSVVLAWLCRSHTEGGWRWRWGDRNGR